MRTLETQVSRPIIMRLLGGLAWFASAYLSAFSLLLPFTTFLAAVLVMIGLVLNVVSKLAFGRAFTTVNPRGLMRSWLSST
ncbi:MAG: hypothetical protein ABI114_00060 [Rhodanobacter sp.]